MYRLFATIVLVLVLALSVSDSVAFTTTLSGSTTALGTTRRCASAPVTPNAATPIVFSTTMTSLNLKVDPKKKTEERMNPAVFENALYLGSIAFAVLLPVALLLAANK